VNAQALEFQIAEELRELIALHEGAHTLTARFFGRSCGGCTIVPGRGYAGLSWNAGEFDPAAFVGGDGSCDASLARCRATKALLPGAGELHTCAAAVYATSREEIVILLAGQVAERIKLGDTFRPRPTEPDLRIARAQAEMVCFCGDAFLAYCGREAEEIVKQYWRSITELARALRAHGTIGPEEIDEAIARGVSLRDRDLERDRRRRWHKLEECAAGKRTDMSRRGVFDT
jgi:hypothetical protein